jgi:hypothetical protein
MDGHYTGVAGSTIFILIRDADYPIEIERHDAQEVRQGLFYKLKKQIGF